MNRRIYLQLALLFAVSSGTGCDYQPTIASQTAVTNSARPTDPTPSTVSHSIEEATFDDLKFDIEPDAAFERTMLEAKAEDLFGKRIRIRGYIYPTLKKKGLKQFVLVRDNLECCFGPGAALYDCILVHMEEGKTAEFSIRPVAVEGTFSFDEFLDFDGTTRAIYRLDGESVE